MDNQGYSPVVDIPRLAEELCTIIRKLEMLLTVVSLQVSKPKKSHPDQNEMQLE
jgi:hypothetical protein